MAAEPTGVEDVAGFEAIVLAGGSSRRLGGADKPALSVGGTTLLDRALAAVDAAVRVVVVGPARATARPVHWHEEQPPGGGPVAAIAAGIVDVTAEYVVVLAADLPAVAPAVPRLLAALDLSTADAAVLVDADDRPNHLAAAWRTDRLRQVLVTLGDPNGVPARLLYAAVDVLAVPDAGGWGHDTDTWDDLAEARRRLEKGSTS
jgi:molybdopterin-guanine dinucleotide biosynthesis protein A